MGMEREGAVMRRGNGRRRLLGVLGGMGPRAHVLFEEHLLTKSVEVLGARRDADFPAWMLASFPATPDRTEALCGDGVSPLPAMRKNLERLAAAGAEFAVAPCVTSHAFLEAADSLPLPLLSLPKVVARIAATTGVRRAGLLATSGTLRSALFQRALAAAGVESVSPLDLPDGEAAQAELVMAAIYGNGGGGGIKGDGPTPETAALLAAAGKKLVAAGAGALVMGCTEIPFAAGHLARIGVPLIDPLAVAAEAAVRYACALPFAPLQGNGDGAWEECIL